MRKGYVLAVLLAGAQLTGAQTTGSGKKKNPAKPVGPAVTSDITIVRKPGQEDGEAQMTVNGKVRKIAPHAVEAWKVRDGEAALVLVLQPPRGAVAKQYMLRYYDLDSGRRRVLGAVPMAKASLKETEDKEELWSFALSGTDLKTNAPVVVIGDDQAVPGVIEGAVQPEFEEDSLHYQMAGGAQIAGGAQTASGAEREAKVGVLLGTGLREIYTPPQGGQGAPKLLQVFPDESSLMIMPDGKVIHGTWDTDGETLTLSGGTASYNTSTLTTPLPMGSYQVTATYSGDDNFMPGSAQIRANGSDALTLD